VEEIKREFEDVKVMGSATAEEWIKGLEGRGKERRNDAARWERWEAGGGIVRIQTLGNHNITTATTMPSGITTPTMNSNLGMYQRPNLLQQSAPFSTTQTHNYLYLSKHLFVSLGLPVSMIARFLNSLMLMWQTLNSKSPASLRFTVTKWVWNISPSPLSTSKT
jgi:hypothetical protein